MEGHAIHPKSWLHFQQDEEHVCAGNRVWKTSWWLLGGMCQGHKHESGRMQDTERQVLYYHNLFQTAAVVQVWHAHAHMHTQNTHTQPLTYTILYHSLPPHHHTLNSWGPGKSCSAFCFLNYPTSQLPLVKARLYSFLSCNISQFPLIYIKLYPFLDCPILPFPSPAGQAVSLIPFPYLWTATFLATIHVLWYFCFNLDLII